MCKKYIIWLMFAFVLVGCNSHFPDTAKPTVPARQNAITIEQVYDVFLGELQKKQFKNFDKLERCFVAGIYKNGQITQMMVSDFSALPVSIYEAPSKYMTVSISANGKREFLNYTRVDGYNTNVVGVVFDDVLKNSINSKILGRANYSDGSVMFLAVIVSFDIKAHLEQKIKNIR